MVTESHDKNSLAGSPGCDCHSYGRDLRRYSNHVVTRRAPTCRVYCLLVLSKCFDMASSNQNGPPLPDIPVNGVDASPIDDKVLATVLLYLSRFF